MDRLNIVDFGALAGSNNAEAINAALAAGKAQGKSVYVPAGVWEYEGILTADSVRLFGEGYSSVLYATNQRNSALNVKGSGTALALLRFSGVPPDERWPNFEGQRISVRFGADGWSVSDCTVDAAISTGVIVAEGAHNGKIIGCHMRGTMADAIHLTGQCHHIVVERNRIEFAGDDGIAVVSYRNDGDVCHDITARDNRVTFNRGGRCMSVVGGADVLYENNTLLGNVNAAGVYIACEASYDTFGPRDVVFRSNLIRATGSEGKDHPSILIFSDGAEPCRDIHVARNIITNTITDTGGVRVYGDVQGVALEANLVIANPEYRIDTEGVTVRPYVVGPVGVRT